MNQNNKTRKILVVDDDPIIRDMMVDILSLEGYPIDTARHGLEAMEILRGEESYLVFLDIMMPVLDGKEVCAILEAEPHLRNRHFIVLMSAVDKLAEVSSLIKNVDATMPKPFSVDDVLRFVLPYME
jgi:CheY-like chemotaxis protein